MGEKTLDEVDKSLLVILALFYLLEKEVFQLFTAIQITGQNNTVNMSKPTSLEFLQAVYLNEELPLSVRLRAAIEAAPYEHPKLTAVGIGYMQGNGFGERLDRAIAASEKAKVVKMIEAQVVDDASENDE